jgi:hypothetical protein
MRFKVGRQSRVSLGNVRGQSQSDRLTKHGPLGDPAAMSARNACIRREI